MTPSEREYLYKILKDESGLVLSGEKDYLVESRLMPIARRNGQSVISELVALIRRPGNEAVKNDIVEAMTTNESFFFRDKTPFAHFTETMMPAFLESRSSQRRLRIWCAAASTGQEPYSLAICLKEMSHRLAGWRIEILGTDISGEVLEKAKTGLYSQFEVQRGLPIQMLTTYFTQVGDMWQVDSAIRAMVQYREFNLLDNMAALGTFDMIFCRNVLIYFDQSTKSVVLDKLAKQMAPDGYLVLGAAETVLGLTKAFRTVPGKRGLYEAGAADGLQFGGANTASSTSPATPPRLVAAGGGLGV
ncbi:MAG: protein-glutamate O-methyltransferase CheR [Fimbriimonadaceae bacterium]|nr:protein-glutamate O-methyltransferase CheR [Alphaproteobacteria bacterium]